MGEQNRSYDYLGHPVPLLEGEISKQESYVIEGRPLWWAKAQCVLGPIPEHPALTSRSGLCRVYLIRNLTEILAYSLTMIKG